MQNNAGKRMVTSIAGLVVMYISVLACMFFFQRKLLYFPDTNIAAPERYGISGFSDIYLKTADGISIQAWYHHAAPDMPTVVYFHGNASHLGNRAGIYSALAGKGLGVMAVEYRGYGKSKGSPSEQGIYADARAAISYLVNEQKIPFDEIIIYGESLGSGVAVQMASEHQVGAVALQAPYTSVANRAAEIYWFLPVGLLIRDRFDSLQKIGTVRSPVIIFHGELDETIPIAHGKKILEAANNPKEGVFFRDVSHNNFDSSTIASHVLDFYLKYKTKKHTQTNTDS